MSQHLQRARVLIGQSRYDLAEQELRRALLDDPNHYEPHALLALCLSNGPRERLEEAEQAGRRAVHLAPDAPFVHANLAQVLAMGDRLKEARASADEAIRLDPNETWHHAVLATVLYRGQRWQEAADAAMQGLRLDPEDQDCLNLRSAALTNMGRGAEAALAIEAALKQNPMNATAHANSGWTSLRERQYKPALEHFKEALRIDPEHEWAKEGLVEALKARNPIYRILLTYSFWMISMGDRARMFVLIGGYVLYRILLAIADSQPEVAPFIRPLLYVYAAFVLLTWWGNPLFESLLRLSPYGRYALTPRDRLASNWFLALLTTGLIALTLWLAADSLAGLVLAAVCGCMIVPICQTCVTLQRDLRRNRMYASAALGALGLLTTCAATFYWEPTPMLIKLFFYAFLAYMIFGNALMARRPSM